MKRWLFRLGALGALGGLLLFGFSNFLADFASQVPPVARPSFSPSVLGIATETVETTTADGLKVKAWWIPLTGSHRPPVIVVHGLGASKEHMMNYILLARQAGHPVLAIDLRGHGESDPSLTTLGYREPRDIHAWLDFLEGRGFNRAILWGTSLGAVTSLRAAAEDGRVAGVIADAPFDTLRNTLAIHGKYLFGLPPFPFAPATAWQLGRKLHFDVDDVDSVAAVRRIRVPVFILAAEKDRRMPLPTVRRIYDAAGDPKKWWVIPGADHETRTFLPDFQAQVTEFLKTIPDKGGEKL